MYKIYMRKNYKTLINKIKELNKWRDYLYIHRQEDSILSRFHIFPTLSTIQATEITTPANYFVKTKKLILKFTWRGQRSRVANSVLKKKKIGRLVLPDIKIHDKATVMKTEC